MEEAKNKAIKLLKKITKAEEKDDCYIFYNDEMKYDGVLVVLKGNYKILSMTEYILLELKKEADHGTGG